MDAESRGPGSVASPDPSSVLSRYPHLTTAIVATAGRRLNVAVRIAPPAIRPLQPGQRVFGCVAPVRYYGSLDAILEAIQQASPGDVLVIDNKGRTYESCIDHVTVLEALSAGMAGAIVWGAHRDTEELAALEFPLFSCGSFPAGPHQVRNTPPDALAAARIGSRVATRDDVVFADSDGIVFVPFVRLGDVVETARAISIDERQQKAAVRAGTSLREQFAFQDFLAQRIADPTYTLARHLRARRGTS